MDACRTNGVSSVPETLAETGRNAYFTESAGYFRAFERFACVLALDMLVFVHRGHPAAFPRNTLQAFDAVAPLRSSIEGCTAGAGG